MCSDPKLGQWLDLKLGWRRPGPAAQGVRQVVLPHVACFWLRTPRQVYAAAKLLHNVGEPPSINWLPEKKKRLTLPWGGQNSSWLHAFKPGRWSISFGLELKYWFFMCVKPLSFQTGNTSLAQSLQLANLACGSWDVSTSINEWDNSLQLISFHVYLCIYTNIFIHLHIHT